MKYLKSNLAKKRTDYKIEPLYSTKKWRTFRRALLAEQGGMCEHCHSTYPDYMLHIDHIQPITSGGEVWDIDNLQVLCKRCHGRKTAKEVLHRGQVEIKNKGAEIPKPSEKYIF